MLGPAQSWTGVPGASEGGVWPSVISGARAWQLVEPLAAGLLLAAESTPFWGDSKRLQSWSAWAGSVALPGTTSVKWSAKPSTAEPNEWGKPGS